MHHLIKKATIGDPSATSRVIERLRPRITKMATYYGRRCDEDPDDLLQEAWIGLLEALPRLDLRIGDPEQYLIQHARWRLLDSMKRARIRRCVSIEEEGDNITDGNQTNPVDDIHVTDFADSLTPLQRRIFHGLLDGLTWREVGDSLGCTSANVAYHVRRISAQYEIWMD